MSAEGWTFREIAPDPTSTCLHESVDVQKEHTNIGSDLRADTRITRVLCNDCNKNLTHLLIERPATPEEIEETKQGWRDLLAQHDKEKHA